MVAGKEEEHVLGGTAIRPEEYHGLAAVKHLLHDPKAGTFCTRTPKSWFLITVFYIIYYSCLAGFWTGMMCIFLTTIDYDRPKWEQDGSIIGSNPGLGLRPRQSEENVGSSMFLLKPNVDIPADPTAEDLLDDFNIGYAARMKKYLDTSMKPNELAVPCPGDAGPPEGKFCQFDYSSLGACGTYPYGYDTASPCVLIKLNKIFGWEPQPIAGESDFPEDQKLWPDSAKEVLRTKFALKQVTVHCRGEYPADEEALEGKIKYFPASQGIPTKYFPYDNVNNTASPLLAVQFTDVKPDQLIHIECRAYYKGVKHSRKEKQGLVRFEIMIDDQNSSK